MPVLAIRNLTKTFTLHTIDGRTVSSLRGVDLDVSAGEHVALAGPSGRASRACCAACTAATCPTPGP